MIYHLKMVEVNEDTNEATVEKEITFPYQFREDVYFVEKKWGKYVVYRGEVWSIWATNICGVELRDYRNYNKHCYTDEEFNMIFKSKKEAIDFCIEQNRRLKVKVYD